MPPTRKTPEDMMMDPPAGSTECHAVPSKDLDVMVQAFEQRKVRGNQSEGLSICSSRLSTTASAEQSGWLALLLG